MVPAQAFDGLGSAGQSERNLDHFQTSAQRVLGGGHGLLQVVETDDPNQAGSDQPVSHGRLVHRPTSRRSSAIRPATSLASSRNRSPRTVIFRALIASPRSRPSWIDPSRSPQISPASNASPAPTRSIASTT